MDPTTVNPTDPWSNVIWDDEQPSEKALLTPHVERAAKELYPGWTYGSVHADPNAVDKVTALSELYAGLESKEPLPDATQPTQDGWENVVWDDEQQGGVGNYLYQTFEPVVKGVQAAGSQLYRGMSNILPPRKTEGPGQVLGRLGGAAIDILGAIPHGVGVMMQENVAKIPGGTTSPGSVPHPFREEPARIPSASEIAGIVGETAAGAIPGRAAVNRVLPTRPPRFLDPADVAAAKTVKELPDDTTPAAVNAPEALPPKGTSVLPATHPLPDEVRPSVVEPPWKKLSEPEPTPPPEPGTLKATTVTPQSETLAQAQRTQVAPVSEAQKTLGGYGPPVPGFLQSAEQKLRRYPEVPEQPTAGMSKTTLPGRTRIAPEQPKAVEPEVPAPKTPKVTSKDEPAFYANPFLAPEKIWEAAKSDPGRATIGATAGYLSADDPETGIARALIGAGAAYGVPKLRQTGAWRKIAEAAWRDPEEVVKNSPEGRNVITKSYNAKDLEDNLNLYFQNKMAGAYKQVGNKPDAIKRINKALDDESGEALNQLSSAERKAYNEARGTFDEIADALNLPKEKRVTSYFPRLRLEAKNEVTKKIVVGERGFYKTSLNSLGKRESNRWFLKERVSDAPADDLGLDPIRAYIRGAAKKISMEGGVDTRSGEKIKGFIHDIEDDLITKIKDPKTGKLKSVDKLKDNDLIDYLTAHINQVAGVGDKADDILEGFGHKVTGYQFMRTIGGNVLSPIVNLTQATLTFAHTSPKAFAGAFKDLKKIRNGDKELKALLQKSGIQGSLSKGDVALLDKLGETKFEKAVDLSGRLFRGSERLLRTHSFMAGYRDAVSKGLKGDAAIQYAKDIVNKTQFRVSKEALPLKWRGENAGIFTQYKGFQLKYARRLKEMVVEDGQDIAKSYNKLSKAYDSGDTVGAMKAAKEVMTDIAGSRSAKFWGAGIGLFGAEGMTLGLYDKETAKNLPKPIRTALEGVLPMFGVYLGHQVGLGALPIEDLRSLMFTIPGPALTMLAEGLSVGASLWTGKDWDLTPTKLLDPRNGTRPIDAEKTLSRFLRLLPAGVQIDRVRKGLIQARTEDGDKVVRRPETASQALGVTPLTKGNQIAREIRTDKTRFPLPGRVGEVTRQTLGLQTPERSSEQAKMGEVKDLESSAKATAQKAARVLLATKDPAKMRAILDKWNKEHGMQYPITPDMVREAVKGTVLPPRTREFLRSPRVLRPRVGETLELFDDDEE